MSRSSPAETTAWVERIHGITLPETLAALAARELDAADRLALAALADSGMEGEPARFGAMLAARAEQLP